MANINSSLFDKKIAYSRRISIFILLSVMIHIAFFSLTAKLTMRFSMISSLSTTKPIMINFLQEEQRKSVKKLVEVSQPSEEKPQNTHNIAEVNSVATGSEITEGDKPGPILDKESDFETLGSEEKKIQLANVIPADTSSKKEKTGEDLSKKVKLEKSLIQKRNNEQSTPVEKGEKGFSDKKVEEAQKNEQEKFNQEKKAELLGTITKNPQGKVYNQVKKEGILGFEALQDQLAPYLREIQKKVEQYWIHFLLTRYSGTKSTEVVIDCEINSEGKIVKIEVVGKTEDPFFAVICKDALQKASPFSPFSFQVPDIYQNRNLQIRWTFRFM